MDYVSLHASLKPNKLVINDLAHERVWTYAEFDLGIARFASLLLDEKISEGDRVACLSKNRAEIIMLHIACARIGAIFVPLNWRLTATEINWQISDSDPSIIFVEDNTESYSVKTRDINTLLDDCKGFSKASKMTLSPNLPSLMLYTSGTTGFPKGALISERNLDETAINSMLLYDVDSQSGFLVDSPMFHIIGLISSVRPALLHGGHIVISDGFIPERTLARMADKDLGITHYFCVPQMAVAMRHVEGFDPKSLTNLKALFTGGAPHPEAQIRDWLKDGIPIVDGYGSSECGSVMGMPLDIDLIDKKAGCVGVPTPRISARVVDDNNQEVPTGERGELQLKGDNVSNGYWKREDASKEAKTLDGWFATGDIVTVDEDGFYKIVDRKKDMFISGGENVYPAEIEALLVKYPGVREQAVVGIPDEKWGEVGCFCYVSDETISAADVEAFLAGRLARYKLPKLTQKVDALPRNGGGKVLKPALKKIYADNNQ